MLAWRSTACAAAFLMAVPNALTASDTTYVEQGARVRVEFEHEMPVANRTGAISYRLERVRWVGTATQLESDTLVFVPDGAEAAIGIPRSKVESIEISQGTKSGVGKGAWMGAAVGTAVGFGFFGVACAATEGGCDSEEVGYGLAMGLGGAAFGAGVGAGVGALSKSERWVQAELPAPPVALHVGKDGSVGLAFSLRH